MMNFPPAARPPRVDLGDRPQDHLQRRLHLILYSAVTVFLTAWFCTMGPIPAILALVVAKHILVALLMMGIGIARERRTA